MTPTDDDMKVAREIVGLVEDEMDKSIHKDGAINAVAVVIARALASQREACAQIADDEPLPSETPPHAIWQELHEAGIVECVRAACRATKKNIAAAIRAGKKG